MIKLLPLQIIVVLICCSCKPIINAVAFHPDTTNIIDSSKLPDGVEELAINTSDNVKLKCLYLPSTATDKIVIYFHGNAGNIYHRIPDLIQLKEFGVSVLGVSYRGYGDSEGKPSENGLYKDGMSVLAFAKNKLNYPEKNIFIFGRSIGTCVAVNTSLNLKLAGVILATPLSTGKQQASVSGLGLFASVAGNSFNNLDKISKIKSPLLVLHGTADKIVPYSIGKTLFNHANTPKEFITIKGGRHNNLQYYQKMYWDSILNFIRKNS